MWVGWSTRALTLGRVATPYLTAPDSAAAVGKPGPVGIGEPGLAETVDSDSLLLQAWQTVKKNAQNAQSLGS